MADVPTGALFGLWADYLDPDHRVNEIGNFYTDQYYTSQPPKTG